ncbi:MAG TPA: hypothetical protein VGQ62_11815 [Chloroflexota bacterium]|jgi:hypothetical protein|nr:hypothetical protein [Chloroflexota bacterium]
MMRSVLPTELARGQVVIVFARWLLVLVGLLVAIWNPDPLPQLRLQIAVILLVAIANFVMHAQLLRHRPTMEAVAYGASLGDLLVISLLIASQGGSSSNLFIFYFPAVLAIAVAFPTRQAAGLSILAVGLAVMVNLIGPAGDDEIILRALAIGAVALIGNAYWRLHRSRISTASPAPSAETEDLFWGQVATLWARWAIVLGGALLVLSRASTTVELAMGILPVVALLTVNFYLHGRYLMERPANRQLTIVASAVDLAIVVGLYLTWPGASGMSNPTFVLLYPLVFAVGLVFPPRLSWAFTSVCVLVYGLLVAASGLSGTSDAKILVERVVILAAVGGLGSLYWRIVRREARSVESHEPSSDTSLAWQPVRAS